MNLHKCAELLRAQDQILILTHNYPDGDTVGSAGALCLALRRMGKTAYICDNPQYTEKFIPFIEGLVAPKDFKPAFIVAADVAAERMLPYGFSGRVALCIDHHPTNSRYADELLLDGDRAACGEIVMKLIKHMTGEITVREAELLYIALSTDTACFRYGNTDARALQDGAKLVELGVDNDKLNTIFFRKLSPARMKLEGMIYDSMSFHHNNTVVIAVVSQEMIASSGATEGDMEDLAGIANRAQGAEIAVTIRELEDGASKVSVRTVNGIDASRICAFFGGGGHPVASGCKIDEKPEKARALLLDVIGGVLHERNTSC